MRFIGNIIAIMIDLHRPFPSDSWVERTAQRLMVLGVDAFILMFLTFPVAIFLPVILVGTVVLFAAGLLLLMGGVGFLLVDMINEIGEEIRQERRERRRVANLLRDPLAEMRHLPAEYRKALHI